MVVPDASKSRVFKLADREAEVAARFRDPAFVPVAAMVAPELLSCIEPALVPVADALTTAEPDKEVVAAAIETMAPSAVLTTAAVDVGAVMVAPVAPKVRVFKLADREAEVAARFRAPALVPAAVALTDTPVTAAPVLVSCTAP